MPGSQIVARLQDLNYRVETLQEPELLVEKAESAKPLLVIADLKPSTEAIEAAIARLKKNPATSHLPSLVFGGESPTPESGPSVTGASLVVSDTAIVGYLPQLLEQVLRVD